MLESKADKRTGILGVEVGTVVVLCVWPDSPGSTSRSSIPFSNSGWSQPLYYKEHLFENLQNLHNKINMNINQRNIPYFSRDTGTCL
jgi:hypothetical protein